MKYILIVKKLTDTGYKTTRNRTEETNEILVLAQLARCYRDANTATREIEHIKNARVWFSVDGNGDKIIRFKFYVKYDEENEYIYIYSFIGCRL